MTSFSNIIQEAKSLIMERIEDKDSLPNYISEKQLYTILGELDKMNSIRNQRLFCPFYPKGIIDSWDYSDPLGHKLLELAELYRKLY